MLGNPVHFWRVTIALALCTAGCRDQAQPDLDLAQESTRAALRTWQQGEIAAKLMTRDVPIEFYDDDWQKGVRLVAYELVKTYRDTDGAPRCAVKLTIQPDRGKVEEIQVTYQVNTSPTIVIARDPFS